jgi:predicted site-specific integrase-resolvase
MELANLFDSLHKVFDQARTKKGDLEQQLHKCEEECSKSVKSVTEAAFGYNRQLQDEQSNLQMLKTLMMILIS